ncbi:MAG: phosphoribosylanthranilate isomerase [Bacteroidota bacterium]
MKVKICGITNLEDAMTASNLGADALGFIFSRESLRYVEPQVARETIMRLPPFTTPVGVFVNASRDEILRVCGISGIRAIQFHGDERPADLEGYALPTYKALRVNTAFNLSSLLEYQSGTFLLDTYCEKEKGGTGKVFDWNIAVAAKQYGNIILAGGLSPENVADAVKTVRPYAIDVNSGVESSPGRKDAIKLQRLFFMLNNL